MNEIQTCTNHSLSEHDQIDYDAMILLRKKERARLEALRESRMALRRQLVQIYKQDCGARKEFPAVNTEPIYHMVRALGCLFYVAACTIKSNNPH